MEEVNLKEREALKCRLESDYVLFLDPTGFDADTKREEILDGWKAHLDKYPEDLNFCFQTLRDKREHQTTLPEPHENLLEMLSAKLFSSDIKAVDVNHLRTELENDFDDYQELSKQIEFPKSWKLLTRWKKFLKEKPEYSDLCLKILFEAENKKNPGSSFLRMESDKPSLAFDLLLAHLGEDPEFNLKYSTYIQAYIELSQRLGIDPNDAQIFIIKKNSRESGEDTYKQPPAIQKFFNKTPHPLLSSTLLPKLFKVFSHFNASNFEHETSSFEEKVAHDILYVMGYWLRPVARNVKSDDEYKSLRQYLYNLEQENPTLKATVANEFAKFQITEIRRQEKIDYTFNDLQHRTETYLEELKKEIIAEGKNTNKNIVFLYKDQNAEVSEITQITGMEENKAEKIKNSINKKVKLYEDVQKLALTLSDATPELTKEIKLQKYMNILFDNHGNKESPSLAERIIKHSGNRTFINAAIVGASFIPLVVPGICLLIYRGVKHRFPWEKEGKVAVKEIVEFQHASRKAELAR